ncbi:recombinase family protein [Vibrio algarum]|uniref:Recombinase family protein n=1 Tax=Vibrio algarum TaxID=3020714 RepID=A0ABT4YPT5_9VIBR|nr:recombinase family protein [Vibrio sp. KJ40-1]MDB1123407.1 recombinase family protein [Vibrio sp. KJ40-1]
MSRRHETQKKKLIVKEDEAAVVREIFRLSLHGTNGKGLGIKAIAKHLDDKGLTNRTSKWSINSLHRILSSTTYYGEFLFRKGAKEKGKLPIIVPVPPIITKEIFEQVKYALEERDVAHIHTKSVRSTSLLTGIVKCGSCGAGMHVCSGKSGRYSYYACATKLKKNVKSCNSKWVPKEALDSLVEETVLTRILKREYIQEILGDVKMQIIGKKEDSKLEMLVLSRKKRTIEEKLGNIYEQLSLRQDLIDDSYAAFVSSMQKQLVDVKSKIKAKNAETRLPLKNFGEKQIGCFVDTLRQLISESDEEAKKALFLQILGEVKVNTDQVEMSGSKLVLLSIISKTKAGTTNVVPAFITKWRRDRDLNPTATIKIRLFYNYLSSFQENQFSHLSGTD